MFSDTRLLDLIDITIPIIQAPMVGASGSEMAIAVSEAGGLGSLPCGTLNPEELREEVKYIREHTTKPLNLNFFCHELPDPDPTRETAWKERLSEYYSELGLDASASASSISRLPFDAAMCEVVEELKPEVVSFHFGLPEQELVRRIKSAGSLILSSATTVKEARWLEAHGCDAIIAQGYEAGGHRGMFLSNDITTQPGTFALVPQVVDAVKVPVIAAGGITDGRGIAAAFALEASCVQIGTAYLFTPESLITDLHRVALHSANDTQTVLTNIFSGRPARGILNRVIEEVGPMSDLAPAFPTAASAIAPLKKNMEEKGFSDFSSMWSGQAASLGRDMSAGELTSKLIVDAERRLKAIATGSV